MSSITGKIMAEWDNDEEIQRFREYLRIPSVHPNINYDECVKFLKKQANQLMLPVNVYEYVQGKPIVVITWEGFKPELPSILLNSHMDVVPVYEEKWTYPPFEAHISEDGWIYARGTQDIKGLGMMHLEAVRRLKDAGIRLKRTIHISFVPEEELGGEEGMRKFSESEEFKRLNIGFELDESAPTEKTDEMIAFHGERTRRQIKVTCAGTPAHGSRLVPGTAGEKLTYILNKFMSYRAKELKILNETRGWFGDRTTVNLTLLEGGVQVNVLPDTLTASFDIRVATDVNHDDFDNMIENWCKEAGEGVTIQYLAKDPQIDNSKIDGDAPFFNAMKKAINDMGITLKCVICPGTTDARYVRAQGIQAINFSPLANTPMLLHAHDEKIHVDAFKRGINVMEKVVEAIANVE